jgi:hypothetical protein
MVQCTVVSHDTTTEGSPQRRVQYGAHRNEDARRMHAQPLMRSLRAPAKPPPLIKCHGFFSNGASSAYCQTGPLTGILSP